MDTVIILNGPSMGAGDVSLGERLVQKALSTLAASGPPPDAIVFYNGAVALLAEDSPSLVHLRVLEDLGTDLLACVTCLEHFDLTRRLGVGTVSSMHDILQVLGRARKVITL